MTWKGCNNREEVIKAVDVFEDEWRNKPQRGPLSQAADKAKRAIDPAWENEATGKRAKATKQCDEAQALLRKFKAEKLKHLRAFMDQVTGVADRMDRKPGIFSSIIPEPDLSPELTKKIEAAEKFIYLCEAGKDPNDNVIDPCHAEVQKAKARLAKLRQSKLSDPTA